MNDQETEFSRVYDNIKYLYKKVWKLIEGTTYIRFAPLFGADRIQRSKIGR